MCDLVEHRSVAYPASVAPCRSRPCCPRRPTTIEQVCRLDMAIGQFFGEVAKELADEHGGRGRLVCSHGQTVYHWVDGDRAPGARCSSAEPAWIAERTGATVVSDVRNRDIAAGGPRGAARQPARRPAARRRPARVRAARSTSAASPTSPSSAGREPLAFDIGPANALIDAAVDVAQRRGRSASTATAAWARPGPSRRGAGRRLLDEPYYALPAPKSTGKELLQPGLRRPAPRRPGDLGRRPAGVADGDHGRVRGGGHPSVRCQPRSSWRAAAPAT